MSLILSVLALTACAGDTTSADELESLSMSMDAELSETDAVIEDWTFSISGLLAVSGEDQDFELIVGGDDQALGLSVHSPGHADMTALSDREVTLTGPTENAGEEGDSLPPIVIEDADGLAYVGTFPGNNIYVADQLLGQGVIQLGKTTGKERGEGGKYRYKSVIIATDDGDVEVFIGEQRSIDLNGSQWSFTLHSAYELDVGRAKCGGGDNLSFELLRLETEAEEDIIARPDGFEPARLNGVCG